jgi:hypothetical protein
MNSVGMLQYIMLRLELSGLIVRREKIPKYPPGWCPGVHYGCLLGFMSAIGFERAVSLREGPLFLGLFLGGLGLSI